MSNEKEMIKKLYKIAMNQQKVITKLAQEANLTGMKQDLLQGPKDVSVIDDVQKELDMLTNNNLDYRVTKAVVGTKSGSLNVTIEIPERDSANFVNISSALRKRLAGKTLKSNEGHVGTVSSNQYDINIVGES